MQSLKVLGVGLFILCACATRSFAQAEVSSWGNLRGIRVSSELVNFTTAVGVFDSDFSQSVLSQREGPIRTSQYVREGTSVTVGQNLRYPTSRPATQPALADAPRPATTNAVTNPVRNGGGGFNRQPANGFNYKMTYTDSAPGTTDVNLSITSTIAQNIAGVFYFVTLPIADFSDGTAELIDGPSADKTSLNRANDQGQVLSQTCKGIRVVGRNNLKVEIDLPQPLTVVVRRNQNREKDESIQIYFPLIVGNTTAGQTATANFTLKAAGPSETSPVTVEIDLSKTGRTWDGIGGNYRIQNLRLDPLHIQYILDNMRVAYGRVALPWNLWQPQEDEAPPLMSGAAPTTNNQNAGGLGPAMDIAQKLSKLNIPMIISVWQPPTWAVLPNNNSGGRGGGGGGGLRLDPTKYDAIAKSLGLYLIYIRDHFGVEPTFFSFNESNAGINVKQSPEEHNAAIKVIGPHFKSIGLKTRMLLGDTGDALPTDFIQIALNDPQATPYIGAVSFHSWRGASDEQYQRWADAATQLGVPLIDAEGGNDAQAAGYSNVFREPWYSLDEAAEYVRIMRICQPEAILEWQFTENYSVLTNDKNGQLAPTQRFYNLKQFNVAPAGATWVAAKSDSGLVLPAAVSDKNGGCTIHLVNNGADRQTTVRGLPASLKQLHVFVTDADRGMKELAAVTVADGSATFKLEKLSLTTLTTESSR